MWRESFQKWDGRGAFLLRLDYGYRVGDAGRSGLDEGAVDLERVPLVRIEEGLLAPRGGAGVRVLKGADRLAALGRRRGAGGLWDALGHAAESEGVLLVARFPRLAEVLGRLLRERGLWAGGTENEALGALPPLYAGLPLHSPLFDLHLACEWETGVARARATTVLVEAGALMSQRGIVSPGLLGLGLGATAGAARSYLNWMAEAGLARRTAGGYALRHPALGRLFEPHESLVPPSPPLGEPHPGEAGADRTGLVPAAGIPRVEPPAAQRSGSRWDPSELD